MKKYNPFSSIMETYLENRRRLATTHALPPPLPPPPSTSSVSKHPLFGPIPPQLLHKYRSPNLSISIYNSPGGHASSSNPPLPQQPSSSSSSSPNQVSPTQQYSSPFTEIYMATIEDDPSDPPFVKPDSVTLNNTCRDQIIIDDVDTSFCNLFTEDYSFLSEECDSFSLKKDDSFSLKKDDSFSLEKDDSFSLVKDDSFSLEEDLEEISASSFYQSLAKGSDLSTPDLKAKKVSDNPVSRKRKSDHIHFGSHNYNTRCKAK